MIFSQRWWVIVVLLFAFAVTVSAPTAQTEEPSPVNAPSSAEVQSSSDEPGQKQSTLTPNRDMTAADVEIDRRVNELWRELLNNRKKTIDDRAKTIDWWLEATAIFLTLLGVAAAILGYFGFKRIDKIASEARENLEKIKEEAQSYVENIKTIRDKLEIDRADSEATCFSSKTGLVRLLKNGVPSPTSQKELTTSVRLKHGLTSAISCLPIMWRERILQAQLLPMARRLS